MPVVRWLNSRTPGASARVTSRTPAGNDRTILPVKGSSRSDTRMNTPALSMARMCEGFNEKLCGDAEPSTSSVGSATPCMTCDTSEWIGLMVTTTSMVSADNGPGAQADPSSKPRDDAADGPS